MFTLHSASAGRHLRRRHLLGLALAGTVTPRLARAVSPPDPAAPIAMLYSALEALMRLGTATPFRHRYQQITPVIDRTFDLPAILHSSVGTRWATLDAAAQDALHAAFRRFTIATYVASFDKYEGERFELMPTLRRVNADEIVQTRIIQDTGDPKRSGPPLPRCRRQTMRHRSRRRRPALIASSPESPLETGNRSCRFFRR